MTPGRLVKAVAVALDVPEETVVQHDRNLVVAGLRTKGGRGRSAPEVTPLDAARLLVATLASIRTKDSVATVKEFEGTIFVPPRSAAERAAEDRARGKGFFYKGREHQQFSTDKFSDLAIISLPEKHNFIQGLTALIKDASDPLPANQRDQFLRRFAGMMIQCEMPHASAWIGGMRDGLVQYRAAPETPLTAEEKETYRDRLRRLQDEHTRYGIYLRVAGISQQRTMYGNAIMLMGLAFREKGLDYATTAKAIDALAGPLPDVAKRKPRAAKKAGKAA